MFEARLSASYGKKQVLRDIRFCLPEGVTALLGRNGSGKSTLLHCIAGALPFEGSVKLDGKELKVLPAREKAKLLSILPQMLPSPDLPAEEVVGFGRSPYSARLSAEEREEVHAAMQKLGIGELATRRVSTLSGGEKQKVFLAMLLVQDTPLVLLDEPTTYMDLPFKSVFFSVLQELKEKKKTVLF
ncbi:MAG TPA: ATP-binding cassette domain-containing protein, partial [Candidatus Gallimonas gallistercoris]|nr:ATP-binding cassette domain-containing protein [Candidatus Gallimonas gallistercoris]